MRPSPAANANSRHLSVVPEETVAERVRRLQAEARELACQQVTMLERNLEEAAEIAQEIADGGDAYPVGARELARRMAEEMHSSALTLAAIRLRH